MLEIPSGRFFKFEAKSYKGEPKWPITQIKNYPIQGFGADLVKLARIEAYKRFLESGLEGEFIATVHDSLVYDVPEKNVQAVAQLLKESVAKVPELCYTMYMYQFKLPMLCEVLAGPSKGNLKEIYV